MKQLSLIRGQINHVVDPWILTLEISSHFMLVICLYRMMLPQIGFYVVTYVNTPIFYGGLLF